MFSDRLVFLVEVLFKACHNLPPSLADIAGMATWAINFIYNIAPELSFTFGFKDGRDVFCFRNVTTGCI